jgi:hypothetical protein
VTPPFGGTPSVSQAGPIQQYKEYNGALSIRRFAGVALVAAEEALCPPQLGRAGAPTSPAARPPPRFVVAVLGEAPAGEELSYRGVVGQVPSRFSRRPGRQSVAWPAYRVTLGCRRLFQWDLVPVGLPGDASGARR